MVTKVLFHSKGPEATSTPLSTSPDLLKADAVGLHPHGVGGEPRALICRCPLHSLAKPAAWCPTAPRESASTLCWAEGSAGIGLLGAGSHQHSRLALLVSPQVWGPSWSCWLMEAGGGGVSPLQDQPRLWRMPGTWGHFLGCPLIPRSLATRLVCRTSTGVSRPLQPGIQKEPPFPKPQGSSRKAEPLPGNRRPTRAGFAELHQCLLGSRAGLHPSKASRPSGGLRGGSCRARGQRYRCTELASVLPVLSTASQSPSFPLSKNKVCLKCWRSRRETSFILSRQTSGQRSGRNEHQREFTEDRKQRVSHWPCRAQFMPLQV